MISDQPIEYFLMLWDFNKTWFNDGIIRKEGVVFFVWMSYWKINYEKEKPLIYHEIYLFIFM